VSDGVWLLLLCVWVVVYVILLVGGDYYDQKQRTAEIEKLFEDWK